MSLDRFVGEVAVVTGASAGIGKSTVEKLVQQGLIVAGISRRVERVQEHANQLKNGNGSLHPFKCDLTKDKEILDTFKKIIETLGPIHILVNNAGVAPATALIDGDIKRWRQIIDTNVIGLSICTREAIANMKANNTKGHIVHVNSVLGHEIGEFPYLSVYPGSKHAVTALTECLRREINRNNLPIKITSVSPGGVSTEFAEVNLGAEGVKRFENVPLLSADDVADTIVYVLSTPEHVNIRELTVNIQGQLY